jgi:hypothetical protein
MNERIEQLALQATDTIEIVNPDTRITHNREFFDKEKFALLIVQECINKIETHKIPVGNSAAGEMACEWTYDALKQIRDEIKEHFGVE